MTAQQTSERHSSVAHETTDVSVRALLIVVMVLFGVGAFLHLAVWTFLSSTMGPGGSGVERAIPFTAAPRPGVAAEPVEPVIPNPVPDPELQVDPSADLRQFRLREERILQTWTTDPHTGLTRMPVDRAMQLLVERYASSRPKPTPPAPPLSEPLTDAGGRKP